LFYEQDAPKILRNQL